MTTTRTPTRRPKSRQVAILQSNYIPWKGYFDLIDRVDEFFLYDEVQYTRGDWRNRNRVKTPDGLKWLTIPVEYSGHELRAIHDVRVVDGRWARKHWTTLANCYARAPHFREYAPAVEALYELAAHQDRLSGVNRLFLDGICELLSITTVIRSTSEYDLGEGRTARLVELCRQVGATSYLSGPAAKAYIDDRLFTDAGVELEYMDYSGYFEYPQLFPPFEHGVTVLDVLFNTGPDAVRLFKAGR